MKLSNLNSPNFGFLAKHDEVLLRHAALAERYIFDDANSALIKLRQFAELLAGHCAANAGIALDNRDSFLEVLDRLWNAGVLDAQVSQLFHGLRKSGNQAAHAHSGDRREALHQLQMARKLAVWFHKSFGGNPKFAPGPFVPPPDPAVAEQELLDELNRLREAEIAIEAKAANLQITLDTQLRLKAEAEASAKRAFDDLTAALELAAESEQELVKQRETFQLRLAEIQAHVADLPAEVRKATIATAHQQATAVNLDEVATRRIIDAQLREAGWEADSQRLRHASGTRPAKGRNLAIAEWPTANGPADYCLFVGLMPVGVVEAKRNCKDVAAAIEQSKRYSRGLAVIDVCASKLTKDSVPPRQSDCEVFSGGWTDLIDLG